MVTKPVLVPACGHDDRFGLARAVRAARDDRRVSASYAPGFATRDIGWNDDDYRYAVVPTWSTFCPWELSEIKWQNMLFGQVTLLWHRLHNGEHQWLREFRDYVSQAEVNVICRRWEEIPRVPTRSGAVSC